MDEPEPQYCWSGVTPYDVEMMIEDQVQYYRMGPWGAWHRLTDEIRESFGFVKTETLESRLARAEWRIGELEADLQRRRDWEEEMRERD